MLDYGKIDKQRLKVINGQSDTKVLYKFLLLQAKNNGSSLIRLFLARGLQGDPLQEIQSSLLAYYPFPVTSIPVSVFSWQHKV